MGPWQPPWNKIRGYREFYTLKSSITIRINRLLWLQVSGELSWSELPGRWQSKLPQGGGERSSLTCIRNMFSSGKKHHFLRRVKGEFNLIRCWMLHPKSIRKSLAKDVHFKMLPKEKGLAVGQSMLKWKLEMKSSRENWLNPYYYEIFHASVFFPKTLTY